MLVGTSNLTKNMDNACVTELEIPLIVMMENAVNSAIKNLDIDENNSYTLVCGVGNNGGDGLGIARKLSVIGKKVEVFLVGKKEKLTECSSINFKILENMGVNLRFLDDKNGIDLEEVLKNYDIDGIVLDRCRYDNLYADFSHVTRNAFEEYLEKEGKVLENFPIQVK